MHNLWGPYCFLCTLKALPLKWKEQWHLAEMDQPLMLEDFPKIFASKNIFMSSSHVTNWWKYSCTPIFNIQLFFFNFEKKCWFLYWSLRVWLLVLCGWLDFFLLYILPLLFSFTVMYVGIVVLLLFICLILNSHASMCTWSCIYLTTHCETPGTLLVVAA